MFPELFLSNFLNKGYIACSLIGSSSLFSMRSNSNGDIYPFLFSSN